MDQSTFIYLNPQGTPDKFAQCGSCVNFTGKSCLQFGSGSSVIAGGSCNLYSYGTPQPKLYGQEYGDMAPHLAGYVEREVRCINCHFYFGADSDCLLYKSLNIPHKVNANGCCNANVAKEAPKRKLKLPR